jgi:hypothetical protein
MTHDPYGQAPGDDQGPGEPQQSGWNPPPYGRQPGYGQQYPYPQPKQDDKALAALIVSIAGWFLCPFVLHVVGLVLANQSLKAIRESGGWLTGEGMANAARIISIISIAVGAIGIALLLLFFLFASVSVA